MMGKKKLSEIKAEVTALLATLPGPSARGWLDHQIKGAQGDRARDVESLEMLRAALEREVRKSRRATRTRRVGKR